MKKSHQRKHSRGSTTGTALMFTGLRVALNRKAVVPLSRLGEHGASSAKKHKKGEPGSIKNSAQPVIEQETNAIFREDW